MKTYSHEEWDALPETEKHAIEKHMLFRHFDNAGRKAVEAFRDKLHAGQVEGDVYFVEDLGCGCIIGTLIHETTGETNPFCMYKDIVPDKWRYDDTVMIENVDAAEDLFFNVAQGDTPETNKTARIVATWTDEWLEDNAPAN